MATSKKRDLYQDIRVLQLVRAVVFAAGAVALVAVLRDITVPANAVYITKDALASQSQTVFVPALRNLFDAPIGYMAAIALVVSGLSALYRYTRGQDEYKRGLKKTSDSLKWIDLGVSSAIIIEVVALFAGVSDPAVIKVCAGAILVTCELGWLADRQNLDAKKVDWSAYGVSIFSGLLPWVAICGSLLFTTLYGAVRLPWYAYALVVSVLVGFGLTALNQMQSIRKSNQWKQYMFTERNYLIIDIATKVAFAGILIVGLKG